MNPFKNILFMALALSAMLTVGNARLSAVHSASITSSWDELGDVCEIELPNLRGQLEGQIKEGDAVTLLLGYNGELNTEFQGYVSEIVPKMPFKLKCEDGVYLLKRTIINNGDGASYKSITLRRLLQTLLADFPVQLSARIPEVDLSPFRIEQGTTVAEVLATLSENYLVATYFRGNTLFVGLPYTEFSTTGSAADQAAGRFANYRFNQNIISDDLTFRSAEDRRMKVRAVSILPDNTKIEVTVGDSQGEERTLTYRNIKSRDALTEIATADLEKYRYSGYSGSFTAFGTPRIIHSGTVALEDPLYGEARSGKYLVQAVKTTYGNGGFRRSITLGPKA